jgi:uncharacterized protein YcbK (DUF882 family)
MTVQATPPRRLARRRAVLGGLAVPLALASAGLPAAPAAAAAAARRERSVLLHHRHTGETLRTVYFADGRYLPEALRAATRHLRDWRDGTQLSVDPRLLDLLSSLRAALGTAAPLEVFCGYRSPATNAMLRRTRRGAARHSLHMRAMAVDLQVRGRSLAAVRRAAVALGGGGVGYYPRSGFVHVDTGEVRYW